jgi:Tol biopolymer transport system component
MKRIARRALAALLVLAALGVGLFLRFREEPLPPEVKGTLVFVSDREGVDSLYVRRLPHGQERRLTVTSEPVRDPALSPDGRQVAFATGGRIGLVPVDAGVVRILTLGVDWQDASPAWRPNGRGLVVSCRKSDGANAELHLIDLDSSGVTRHPLTQTRGLDDSAPVFSPDGSFVVFVREDNLFRVGLADGRTARLTGGFKRSRCPRFLPSGRLLCLWSEGKNYGIDVLDADGRNRETLSQGSVYYRSLVPSPEGRFLAATFTFDLRFHPTQALKLRQTEEVHLLDARGSFLRSLERSWRYASHSPSWGR